MKSPVFLKVSFNIENCEDFVFDMLSYSLSEIGFDSFEDSEGIFNAYISISDFSSDKVDEVLSSCDFYKGITYTFSELENKDWNEEWEKNYFTPIVIGDKCVVASTFHTNVPKCPIKILINPRMSFGTGHHQTTRLMSETILDMDLKDKMVMDMGCGTAILSILAALCGASYVDAIDIDEWAYENSIDNLKLNNVDDKITVCQGDVSSLRSVVEKYDVFLANINKNILLADIPLYAPSIKNGGTLVISGFYNEDIEDLIAVAQKSGFSFESKKVLDNWTCVRLKKN